MVTQLNPKKRDSGIWEPHVSLKMPIFCEVSPGMVYLWMGICRAAHLFDHGDLLLPDQLSDSPALGHVVFLLPGREDVTGGLLVCGDRGRDCPER